MNVEEARKNLQRKIDLYNSYKDDKNFVGNEKQVCHNLIVPLIKEVLHWNTDDYAEFKTEESLSGKRVDYVVLNQGISQFIVEAKAPSKDIFDNEDYYKQALGYGYGKEKDFAILTNFRQVVILACQIQWRGPREAELARFNLLTATDDELKLLLAFEKEYWLRAGKDNLLYLRTSKHKKTIPVDERLLEDMKYWREQLLRNIKANSRFNKFDFDDEQEFMRVEEEVQKFIDRLIFICFCEDKELHEPQLKRHMHDKKERFDMNPGWLLDKIRELFVEYRRIYDSDLFDKNDCDTFKIDDDKLLEVIEQLREPKGKAAYDFKSIEADILGKTYENFIGHVQTGKKRFKEKEDIGKRKKEGIYYTPKYIVDYIVSNTVKEYVKGKSFEEIKKVRILDPACGSGSFLRVAFDVLVEEGQRAVKRPLHYAEKKELLLNCIYGVDLDRRAVEIAKFNLSLKLAERGQKLPVLRENIKHGNSLIDDPQIAGYDAFVWEEEFKEIMQNGGFDVVVGNPPYFGIRTLNSKIQNYFKCSPRWKEQHTRQADIYYYFIIQAIKSLRQVGCVGFIVGRYWLEATDAGVLRKFISDNCTIERIVDFRDISIFQDANIHTSIIILKKIKDKKTKVKVSIMDSTMIGEASSEIFNEKSYFESDQSGLSNSRWIFMEGKENNIFNKIAQTGTKLSELFHVGTGVQTGRDGAFVIDKLQALENNLERDGLGHWIKNGQVRRYSLESPNLLVIKGRLDLDLQHFKKIMAYLLEKKTELTARYEYKKDKCKWYQWSTVREIKLFDLDKKIICPYKSGSSNFTLLQNTNTYFSKDIYQLIKLEKTRGEYEFFLGILNSKVIQYFFSNYGKKMGSITEFYAEAMLDIPLKQLDLQKRQDQETHDKCVELVKKLLSLNKQLTEISENKKDLRVKIDAEIEKTDTEIDELVYKLYGITEEEKKIIEESLNL